MFWKDNKSDAFTEANVECSLIKEDLDKGGFPSRKNDKLVLQPIMRRRGQQKFRKKLMAAYGYRCAISRCAVADVLEAAHVKPHANFGKYELSNGILMRSDLHTLFDLNLLEIEPATLKIVLDETVRSSQQYADFHGKKMDQPKKIASQTNRVYLRQRWKSYPKVV